MKAFLQFGDWELEGHKLCENVLVEINSFEDVVNAQNKIREKYGKYFFFGFANNWDDSSLSKDCWFALFAEGMPSRLFVDYNSDMIGCPDIQDIRDAVSADDEEEFPYVPLNFAFVKQAFVWLLNQFGANIKIVSERDCIPYINGYTCPGFENIGYGCFYDDQGGYKIQLWHKSFILVI